MLPFWYIIITFSFAYLAISTLKEVRIKMKGNTYLFDEALKNADSFTNADRFQSFSDRRLESVLNLDFIKTMAVGKYHTTWEGEAMMKDPLTMGIYGTLIAKERIQTVFELGSYLGSSALWLKTLLANSGSGPNAGRVVSFDYDLSRIPERFQGRPGVEFLYLDANVPEEVLTPEFMARADLPHPWLIIEDCHVNVEGLLHTFDKYCIAGDYVFVEDTNPQANAKPMALDGSGLMCDGTEFEEYGLIKHKQVETFLSETKSDYRVDSAYTDLYGYNSSMQWNSILRKF